MKELCFSEFQLWMCPRGDRKVRMEWKSKECVVMWWVARGCGQQLRKVEVLEDCDARSHKIVMFEVRCQQEPEEVGIFKVSKPLPGVSGENTFNQ